MSLIWAIVFYEHPQKAKKKQDSSSCMFLSFNQNKIDYETIRNFLRIQLIVKVSDFIFIIEIKISFVMLSSIN